MAVGNTYGKIRTVNGRLQQQVIPRVNDAEDWGQGDMMRWEDIGPAPESTQSSATDGLPEHEVFVPGGDPNAPGGVHNRPPVQVNLTGELPTTEDGTYSNIYDYVEAQVTDPKIPESGKQTYTEISAKDDEFIDPDKLTLGSDYNVDDPRQVKSSEAPNPLTPDATTYNASKVEEAAQMVAATGELPEDAYVSKRLEGLLEGLEDGELPYWSRNAVVAADKALADRGFARSNVARESLYNAVIQSALPIAQSEAEAKQREYFTNLNNTQRANEVNMLARQEVLLTDAAAENASQQFNATSKNQLDQFRSSLKASIDTNNSARRDAMEQFNVNNELAVNQYNSQTRFNRDTFNANLASVIEQSNVNWRRNINTVNTAGVNAVNQANAMNAFNLSNQALTFLWQEARDYALWSWTGSQNEEERKTRLAIAAMGAQAVGDSIEANFLSSVGGLAYDIFRDIITSE